jgi:uncharacterized membrane protein
LALFKSIKSRIKAYFVAGLLAVVPLSFTVYVISILLKHGDKVFNLLPERFNPRTYISYPIPGLGIAVVLVLILLTGVLVKNYVGGRIMDIGERIVYRIPLVRPVHSAVKQLLIAIFSQSDESFKRVVLVEYPRRGMYAIGFVTGVSTGEVQAVTDERVINIFLPTTPNPTSGFYLLVPERDTIALAMTVEDAFKLLISGGLVSPNADNADNADNAKKNRRNQVSMAQQP